MDHKEAHHLRLYVLAALFFIVAAVYIGVLYDTQVNNYDYYYASSVRSIARSETVEAARGNITDRNGKVLVSSRSSYNLTFDASLLEKDEDANESLLRLLQLCQSRGGRRRSGPEVPAPRTKQPPAAVPPAPAGARSVPLTRDSDS